MRHGARVSREAILLLAFADHVGCVLGDLRPQPPRLGRFLRLIEQATSLSVNGQKQRRRRYSCKGGASHP